MGSKETVGADNKDTGIAGRIALALGNRITKDKAIKLAFAEAVLRPIIFSEFEHDSIPIEKGTSLLKKLRALRVALEDFQGTFIRMWEADGANNKTKAICGLGVMEATNNLPKFLNLFEAELSLRIPTKKRGKDNSQQLAMAKMIAIHYRNFFKQDPSTGKGNMVGSRSRSKLKKSPYDRVCDVIEREYQFIGRMTNSTRAQAIQAVKDGGGIRPHKTVLFYPAIFKGARGKT